MSHYWNWNLPNKTTKSFVVRPNDAKFCLRLEKLKNGDGKRVSASEANEIFPSFLPRGTSQKGPFICNM